eukprot:236570_1
MEASIPPDNAAIILKQTERYVQQIIFVNSFISTSIKFLIVCISPIYLKDELGASLSMIGTAGFFITGCAVFRQMGLPMLTSSKYYRYLSYDITTTVSHAIQIIIFLAMANVRSSILFLALGALNALCTVSMETSSGVIALLLPTHSAMRHTQLSVTVDNFSTVIGMLLVPLCLSIGSFRVVFYILAGIYACLFVFNLRFVVRKEWELLEKQMMEFDEAFVIEKINRLATGQKLRGSISLDFSIMKMLSRRTSDESHTQEMFSSDDIVNICVSDIRRGTDSLNALAELSESSEEPSDGTIDKPENGSAPDLFERKMTFPVHFKKGRTLYDRKKK